MKWCNVVVSVMVVFFFTSVDSIFAQGIVPAGKEDFKGSGYGTCEFVELVNNGIAFLIGLFALLAVIVFIYAGYLLVSSRGNVAVMQQAKTLFTNVLIGLVIMLSAFLVINTILGIMVGGSSGILNWASPPCSYENQAGNPAVIDISLTTHTAEILVPNGDGTSVSLTSTAGGPTGGSIRAGACDTSTMSTINFMGGSVTVNSGLVPSLQRIDAQWNSSGGNSYYRVTSIGSFSCRAIAGSGRMSNHSYGIALDINSLQNPHCPSNAKCNGQNVLITDMHDSRFYDLWTAEGWGWGGNWNSSKDAMHFSKATNEGGNMSY